MVTGTARTATPTGSCTLLAVILRLFNRGLGDGDDAIGIAPDWCRPAAILA